MSIDCIYRLYTIRVPAGETADGKPLADPVYRQFQAETALATQFLQVTTTEGYETRYRYATPSNHIERRRMYLFTFIARVTRGDEVAKAAREIGEMFQQTAVQVQGVPIESDNLYTV